MAYRKNVKRELQMLGAYAPDFFKPFLTESDLQPHWSERFSVTVDKRLQAIALLYAERESHHGLKVTGARSHEGARGFERESRIDQHAGHLGIGTITKNNEIITERAMSLIRSLAGREKKPESLSKLIERCPAFFGLVQDGFHLDSYSQMVDGFINLSEGQVERPFINKLNSQLPIMRIAENGNELHMNLMTEAYLIVDFLIETVSTGLEDRALGIKTGKFTEFKQKSNLYQGKESPFLEASIEVVRSVEFKNQLVNDALSKSCYYHEHAEEGREQLDALPGLKKYYYKGEENEEPPIHIIAKEESIAGEE